jgi:hypothetical protein
MDNWAIELSTWVLVDGNYDTVNFEIGQIVRFAVQFYLPQFSVCSDFPMLKPVGGRPSFYDTVAESVFQAENAWVLDLGEIAVYAKSPPNYVKTGQHVRGTLSLHVDPFDYYEELNNLPGIPPLIYEWRIHGIEMDTSPFVEKIDEHGELVTVRGKPCFEPVNQIDSRTDRGNGSFVLNCAKIDHPPGKNI